MSELIAEATGQWELYSTEEKIALPTIPVNIDQLLNHVAQNEAFYDPIFSTLESSNQPYIALEYETLVSEFEQKRTLAFLGVPSVNFRLTPVSVKQTPMDLRMVLSNFSELDQMLSGTDYHRELHDLS